MNQKSMYGQAGYQAVNLVFPRLGNVIGFFRGFTQACLIFKYWEMEDWYEKENVFFMDHTSAVYRVF